MTGIVITFVVAAAALILAATALSKAGNTIAEKTGIGRVWIGAVLVAGATSLPELAVDVSAVRIGAADLAAGDLFGSTMANMLILAVVDLAHRRGNVLRTASFDNILAAGLAIFLNALAALLVITRPTIAVFGVAPASLALVVIYVLGTRAVYRQGARHVGAPPVPALQTIAPDDNGVAQQRERAVLHRAVVLFFAAAAVIFVVAPFLASSAREIADVSGLGSTFVGTLLVGLVTSLPELVASVVAVRIGAVDLAVGNLFGSNAFNMIVFFAMDLAAPGSIFAALDASHAISALCGVALMGLGIAAIVYRAERRFALIEPDSFVMLLVYLLGVAFLYLHVS